jgi:signal transduction histidine kinase
VPEQQIPKILIVNDDAGSLMALVGLLSSWENEVSYEVITARSGEEALRQVLIHDFAAILLDVNMPGMDGFETAEAIHLRARSAATPIIFVTAYLADEMNRLKGYQMGAVDYLFTPIIPQILKAKLDVFVGLAKKSLELKLKTDTLDRRGKELAAINARLEFEINERKIAEHQNKSKDQFLAMLGHELRNPLSAITSAASIINLEGVKPESVAYAKGVIQRQSQHLSRIVDDLLDLSRVMSGKVVLNKRPLDLSRLVESCVETLAVTGRTEQYGIQIHTEQAWVDADPTRIEQLIINLLDNALKYTPAGGKIEIGVRMQSDEVELSVRDTGIGITSDLLPHVFDVFVQGERTLDRSQGGLGIGLALVRQLAFLHGGRVSAHSMGSGQGSEFRLRMPAHAESPSHSHERTGPALQTQYAILLIEDNKDAREAMSLMLASLGHKVMQACEGLEGIRMARENRPDVIVIDIGLPGIDGHEVARRLRALPNTGGIPLIALTGYGLERDRQLALDAGFNMHLAKPTGADELLKAIDLCVSQAIKMKA